MGMKGSLPSSVSQALAYDDGLLVEACTTQQASPNGPTLTYINGGLRTDVTTPKAMRSCSPLLFDSSAS